MPRSQRAVERQTGIEYKLVSFRRCPSRYRRNYLRGWQDAMAEVGYPDDFDTMSDYTQQAYEEGRLDACNVKTAGIEVPYWNTITDQPDAIKRAIWRANHLTGDAQPADVMVT